MQMFVSNFNNRDQIAQPILRTQRTLKNTRRSQVETAKLGSAFVFVEPPRNGSMLARRRAADNIGVSFSGTAAVAGRASFGAHVQLRLAGERTDQSTAGTPGKPSVLLTIIFDGADDQEQQGPVDVAHGVAQREGGVRLRRCQTKSKLDSLSMAATCVPACLPNANL